MAIIEGCREIPASQYSRDARGIGMKTAIAAYEERWGEGCTPVRPEKPIIVSIREVPGTQLVKNGDGKIIRIPDFRPITQR